MFHVKLLNNDCFNILDSIKEVDLVLTDPPYDTINCEWDIKLDLAKMWELLLDCTNPNATFIFFGAMPFTAKLYNSNPKMYNNHIVWKKGHFANFLNANRYPLKVHEDILVFTKNSKYIFNRKETGLTKLVKSKAKTHIYDNHNPVYTQDIRKSIYSVMEYGKDKQKLHPTQKPTRLLDNLIEIYSKPGDIILDPFMGSGSTGYSALSLQRRFIGIEKDRKFYEIAVNRLGDVPIVKSEQMKQEKLF